MSVIFEFRDLLRGRMLVVPATRLVLPRGKPIGFVGVNGAGKSTMLMAAAGILARDACRFDGQASDRVAAGYVPQEYPLMAGVCVEAVCRTFQCELDEMAERMPGLHLHELRRKRVDRLSPGQRQAVANAIALTVRSDFLVFDEPFSALDVRRRTGLRSCIRAAAATKPVLLSSQAGADLVTLCDHFVLLRSGRIVFDGPLEELLDIDTDAPGLAERFEQVVAERIV